MRGSGGGWRVGVSADAAIQHSAEKRRVSGGQAPWLSAKFYLWQQCLFSFKNAGFILSWQVHDHCDYCSAGADSNEVIGKKLIKRLIKCFTLLGRCFVLLVLFQMWPFDVKSNSSKTLFVIYYTMGPVTKGSPTPPHQTALKTNLLWNPCLHICTMYLPAPKATFLKTPWKSPLICTSEKTTPSLWPLMGNPSSSQPFFPSKMQQF